MKCVIGKNLLLSIALLAAFSACQNTDKEEFDENDYYEVQGVITKVNPAIVKGQRHLASYYFTYIDQDSTLKRGNEKYIETRIRIRKGSPVTIMIHKDDSLDLFIWELGVVNKESWKTLQELENTSNQ